MNTIFLKKHNRLITEILMVNMRRDFGRIASKIHLYNSYEDECLIKRIVSAQFFSFEEFIKLIRKERSLNVFSIKKFNGFKFSIK